MSERRPAPVSTGDRAINWRQHSSSVTIYEEGNPDAWVRVDFEAGIPPEHRLFMICSACGAVFAQRSTPGSATVCGDCETTFDHRHDD